jgi:hypothetical protein
VNGDEPTPVSGAIEELRGGAGDPGGVRSGLDGRVEMTVPMREEQSYQRFTYAAPGFALGSVEAKALAGETTPLGDLVLVPGASVAGFVVDPYKRRIADVEVWCSSDPVDDEELSTVLFRQGPLWKKALTPGNRRLSTRSGPDGSFFLAGAPAGTQRIWAHAEGRRYGWTPEIELVAGVAVSGIEVTSAELRTEDTISGVVLDPDGDPVANGEIRYGFEMPNFGLSSGLFTDSNGRFELVAWGDVPYRLTARAPRSQWADVAHPEVYPGTNDLVFQFREAEWIELVVRGEEGEAIAEPRVSLSFDEGSGKTQHTETQAGHTERRGEGKDERLFVRAHSSEFSIEVGAVGYARQSYGPFDPDSPPAKLTCELRRAAAIRGFVTADGAPVAGARVELYEPAPSHYTMDCDGFPTRLSCSPKESATSAEDGSFSMNFTADGRYVLRAEKDGFAATETDELELYARVGMSDIELPLTQGGRLVVTVRKADGSDPTGTVVGVSHGDGKAQTRRVGADGRVAFDKVTPGRWDVTEREVELDPSSRTATSSGLPDGVEAPEVPWVCEVHEGGTTRYELVIGE